MNTKTPHQKISVGALTLTIVSDGKAAPTEIQLVPSGRFKAKDGRPHEVPSKHWFIDAQTAAVVIALTEQSVNDLVIDYEHQTLLKEKNGRPAPAAGWFKKLEWRESGLWAVDVRWTPRAEQMILNGEYRYLSPVFNYDETTGQVLKMRMAAITNAPAVDGMQALATLTQEDFNRLIPQTKEKSMKTLLKRLGLDENATEDQAVAALTQLQQQASDNETKAKEAETKVAALTEQVDKPDPSKWVPVSVMQDLQTQVAALTEQNARGSVSKVVEDAIKEGKLLPAQKNWAISLGQINLVALTEYLDTAKPIAAFKGSQASADDSQKPSSQAALTEDQKALMKAFGNTQQDLDKYAS